MKIIISPAKSLDFETRIPVKRQSKPLFLEYSKKVHQSLQKKDPKQLMELMNISKKLADLNWERNEQRDFKYSKVDKTHRQAVFAFNGDVYEGIDAYGLSEKEIEFLQKHLRILSGLYGYLRPLDIIEPYRLEMGTRLQVGKADNLYEFWYEILPKKLQSELKINEVLVNLASQEYAKAVDLKNFNRRIITPEFKDYKNGKLTTISFFAKKARGMMVKFIAQNQITEVEDIKAFHLDNYTFDQNQSKENHWVFTR